jgi:hypothetical protein
MKHTGKDSKTVTASKPKLWFEVNPYQFVLAFALVTAKQHQVRVTATVNDKCRVTVATYAMFASDLVC